MQAFRGRKRVVLIGEGVLRQTAAAIRATSFNGSGECLQVGIPLSPQYPIHAVAESVGDLVKCLPLPLPIFEGLNLALSFDWSTPFSQSDAKKQRATPRGCL